MHPLVPWGARRRRSRDLPVTRIAFSVPMRKPFATASLLCVIALRTFAAEPAGAVAKDGFPAGVDSPEGAACDLARAFIHDDPALFLATCIEPFGDPEARMARHQFVQSVVVQMKMDSAGKAPPPNSPKSIAKCFAARHLSKGAPTSYGAPFGFQDVMFVDVSALLQNGETQVCRTLVIKNKQGKWVVDPQPESSPLFSAGLDDESPSTQEFPGPSPAR